MINASAWLNVAGRRQRAEEYMDRGIRCLTNVAVLQALIDILFPPEEEIYQYVDAELYGSYTETEVFVVEARATGSYTVMAQYVDAWLYGGYTTMAQFVDAWLFGSYTESTV